MRHSLGDACPANREGQADGLILPLQERTEHVLRNYGRWTRCPCVGRMVQVSANREKVGSSAFERTLRPADYAASFLISTSIRGPFHGTPGQTGAWIRHDPAFGIAAEVMGSEICDSGPPGSPLHNVPNGFRCDVLPPDRASSANSAEDKIGRDSGSPGPAIDRAFHPVRHWNRAL